MKRIYLSVLLIGCSICTLWAQNTNNTTTLLSATDSNRFDNVSKEVWRAYQARYFNDGEGDTTRYLRWLNFWEGRVCNNLPDTAHVAGGDAIGPMMYLELDASCLNDTGNFMGNWTCIGPYRNSYGAVGSNVQKSGRVQALWVNPSDTNDIMAGSSAGGLWRSWDAGRNWFNITDASPNAITGTMGICDIAVNPQNQDIIYLSTGTQQLFASHWNGNYGLGLVYSNNGGSHWQADPDFRQVSGTAQDQGMSDGDHWVRKIAYKPSSQRLYAIAGRKIYLKASPTQNWQSITPNFVRFWPAGYHFTDFQFTYNPAGKVVFSTNCIGNTQYLIVYDESTQTWQTVSVVIPGYMNGAQGYNDWGIHAFSMSPSNKAYMGLFLATGTTGTGYNNLLYKIDLTPGSAPVALNTNNALNGLEHIVVSPKNENIIYITTATGYPSSVIQRSTNGGSAFQNIGSTHADGRALLLYKATTSANGIDDIIFAGTDGGVTKKSKGQSQFHSIMGDGICIAQMYGLSSDPTDDAYLTAGAQDNGSQSYDRKATDPWDANYISWGDGLRSAFANNGVHQSYMQTNNYMSGLNFTGAQRSNMSGPYAPNDITPTPSFLRRVKFDQNNLAKAGYHYIWQQNIGDAVWLPTFGGPIPTNTLEPKPWPLQSDELNDKRSIDFIFPESAPNSAYLAYFGTTYQPVQLTDDIHARLYYSSNISATPIAWQNRTPALAQYYTLTDIETDPAHPNRIWASFGNVNWMDIQNNTPRSQRQNRVWYSDDYGAHWQDKSKGLTALPIHKVIYIPGSFDVLFAATDFGVFRWNKSEDQWDCFNNNMPKQIVTDIEYIPCSGKLRVSTYGRGVWETDISPVQADYVPGETDIIGSNTTWNSSRTVTGGIRVKTGATLTISGASTTVYMPRNAEITVETGAKLVVDGATITNECNNCKWGGIALTGNENQPPFPQYQASLVLENNATLENAFIAVNNYSWDNGAQGGGLIDATNSNIHNCWRAVALNGYGNYSYKYQSTVSRCRFDHMKFIVDNPEMYSYYGHSDYFTSFDTKDGVEITNSVFTDNIPTGAIPDNKRGRGIYTLATGLKVQNCTFTGLNEGVHCEGYANLPTRTVSVFLSDFSNINHAITLNGTAYANIKGNTINNMVLNSYDPSGAYGIYLNQSAGAYIGCHNQIDGTFGGTHNGRYGIIVNDSRKRATTIIDNTITNTYVATQTQHINLSLNIFCNDYEHNDYAWAINPQSVNSWFNNQGTGCQSTQIRAGNIFKSNQRDIYSYIVPAWDYYAGNGSSYEFPFLSSGTVNVFPCTMNANSQCNDFASCVYDWTDVLQGQVLSQYSELKNDGFKLRADAVRLYGHIIRGYNYLDEEPQLQSFLEAENDDRSRKLLIPMYVSKGMYDQVTETIDQLTLSEDERMGYISYYDLLINLHQNDRSMNELTSSELEMVEGLAADTLEVSPYAKGYLDWWYQQEWENPIEPLPLSKGTGEVIEPETPGYVATSLGNAVPNPTSSKTAVDVYIGSRDAVKHPVFIIHNTMGKEMYRQPLEAGENHIEVNTGTWEPGIYVYSLLLNNAVSVSKKLSVTR